MRRATRSALKSFTPRQMHCQESTALSSTLSSTASCKAFSTAFSYAAAEQVDIIVCYADGRNDYEASWMLPTDQQDETGKQGMGRSDSIWNELNVIGEIGRAHV